MSGKHGKKRAGWASGMTRGDAAMGITLIELLTAMAIMAVLVTIAWPAYTDSLRKARRMDAVTALQQVQMRQERYRAGYHRYAEHLVELGYAGEEVDSPQAHYRLRLLEPATAEAGYLAVAEPRPGSDQARDACGAFAVDAAGPVPGQPADPDCWPR